MTISPETVPDDVLRVILDGCEGVTPGPWDVDEGTTERPSILVSRDIDADDRGRAVNYKTEIATMADYSDEDATVAHIARLDPKTVSSMARELLSLRASRPADAATVQDYEEATASHLAHVRDLDVAMNGDGAAKRPLLIDIKAELLDRIEFYRRSRAGNGAVKTRDWEDDPASDDGWNAGCDYAITQLCNIFGVDPKAISWDAATETLDGDVGAVLCNVLRAVYGEEWASNKQTTARILSALSPAPADNEKLREDGK